VAIVIAGLTVQWIVSRISNQPVGTDLHPLSLLAFAGPPISTLIFIAGVKQLRRHRHFVKNGVLLLGTIDWNRSETRELIQRSGGPGGSTTQGWNVTLVYYFTNPDGQAILTSKEFVSHKAPGWFVTHSKKYVAVLYLAENMYDIL
jgi:hypothetical protein